MRMLNNSEINDLNLICFIVNSGLGSKIIQRAKHEGVSGGIDTFIKMDNK